jgi:S1-C subfamily serine protease
MAGKTIETVKDLDRVKAAYKPGDTVTVIVNRDGRKLELKLTFGEER